ncbi:MAG: hypothetical protein ABL921_35405, partial [Pirellula sp.]
YRRDGATLDSMDGGLAGQEWKDYAKQSDRVWYVGGSNADDAFTVDYVTEPGPLQNRHLVTRLTNNNGNFSFAAQLQLDFDAKDTSGKLIWDPKQILANIAAFDTLNPVDRKLAIKEQVLKGNLLPPEGDYLAILIDALGGNDTITVGPTVQKTVWIDAGPGDDTVKINSGNAILIDRLDEGSRNDSIATAAPLAPVSIIGTVAGPSNGQLAATASFALAVNGRDLVTVDIAADAANASFNDLVADVNAALAENGLSNLVVASNVNGKLAISTRDIADVSLAIDAVNSVALNQLGLSSGQATTRANVKSLAITNLTLDNPSDVDWYKLQFPGTTATISSNSASALDALSLKLYTGTTINSTLVSAQYAYDLAERTVDANGYVSNNNDVPNRAYPLRADPLDDLSTVNSIEGLTFHQASDVDWFDFALPNSGLNDSRSLQLYTTSSGAKFAQADFYEANGTTLLFSQTNIANGGSLSLASLEGGYYKLKLTATVPGPYALYPHVTGTAANSLNLTGTKTAPLALVSLNTSADYWLEVRSQNIVPTIYNLNVTTTLDAPLSIIGGRSTDSSQRRDGILGGSG